MRRGLSLVLLAVSVSACGLSIGIDRIEPGDSGPRLTVQLTDRTTATSVISSTETVFVDDDAVVAHTCDGLGVKIEGDGGEYTLQGACGDILISGSFNTVFVDHAHSISLTGTRNAVIYSASRPMVDDLDGDNLVTSG